MGRRRRRQEREGPTGPRRLIIRPAPKAPWDASLRDVEKVLYSAADELWRYFPERSLPPLLVEPKGGPIVLFRRGPEGEYYVRLNTGNTYWSQYAFQFAHEFGHVLCGYREGERCNKWFEESLCETASLFALRGMSLTWKSDPPYPNWKSYAPALRDYAKSGWTARRCPRGRRWRNGTNKTRPSWPSSRATAKRTASWRACCCRCSRSSRNVGRP